MKLKEWVAYWQETYDKPAVRPSTYQAHGYLLKNHIVPRLGEMELTDITESTVQRFLKDCRDHGNLRRNEPLSQETMRHICVLLSGILNQAVNDGHMENRTFNAEKPPKTAVFPRNLVRVTGFEPAASCSQSRRATNCATPGY